MADTRRRAQAIVQECRREGCEFSGGIARVTCVEDGHSVGVAYVPASQLEGAVGRVAELERALDLAASDLRAEGHYEASARAYAPLEADPGGR